MENEILLYSPIWDFTARAFIERLQEIPEDQEVTVRINSPGGSVFAGWGVIAALQERTGKTIAKIDGNVSSMAFFMSMFFDEVQALDVSSLMIHRADAVIRDEQEQKLLDDTNKALRAKLEKRIDPDTFEKATGVSFDSLFSSEERIDVWISAKQAKKIGLVDKIVRLEPREIEAFKSNLVAFSNFESAEAPEASHGSEKETQQEILTNNIETMTKQEIKQQNPEVYAAIIQDERSRVNAILKFSDVDFEACRKMIESGQEPGAEFFAEMSRKAIANVQLKGMTEESDKVIEVDTEAEKTQAPQAEEKDQEKIAFTNAMRAAAGLKNEEGK